MSQKLQESKKQHISKIIFRPSMASGAKFVSFREGTLCESGRLFWIFLFSGCAIFDVPQSPSSNQFLSSNLISIGRLGSQQKQPERNRRTFLVFRQQTWLFLLWGSVTWIVKSGCRVWELFFWISKKMLFWHNRIVLQYQHVRILSHKKAGWWMHGWLSRQISDIKNWIPCTEIWNVWFLWKDSPEPGKKKRPYWNRYTGWKTGILRIVYYIF